MLRRRRAPALSPRPRTPRRLGSGATAIVVEVRESSRARRARLVVRPGGAAEAVVPCGSPERTVDELVGAHRDWIVHRVLRERERMASGPTLGLGRPDALPLQGAWLPLVRNGGVRAEAHLEGGVLVVSSPDDERARAAVLRWYRREARTIVASSVAREARRLGVEPGPLSIRDQRSRWASCSRRGALSFSWRLVLAPQDVLDYVVVHELCHLVEPNHSKAFWRVVEDARPDWKRDAAWLRTHGHELHAFDPCRLAPSP